MFFSKQRCLTAFLAFFIFLPLPFTANAAESSADAKYDMKETVTRALEENFTVQAAKETAKAAESNRQAARGAFGPSLGATYDYQRRQNRFAPGAPPASRTKTFSPGASGCAKTYFLGLPR
jgi:outer membrane protein TolC